jgi:hypothetical protein
MSEPMTQISNKRDSLTYNKVNNVVPPPMKDFNFICTNLNYVLGPSLSSFVRFEYED